MATIDSDTLDDIITRQYTNFMGVDFRGGEVPYYHSPDSINMWRDYQDSDCIQTRPGMTLLKKFDNEIFGLFFYKLDTAVKVLVHSGTTLYLWNNYPDGTPTILYSGLIATQSKSFVYDGVFYLMDGKHYLKYDGTTIQDVEGYIPTTSYWQNPDGSEDMDSSTDTDTINQNINCLTSKRRNKFVSDGISTEYHLDTQGLNSMTVQIETYDVQTKATATLTEGTDFTVDRTTGYITFNTAPDENKYVYVLFGVDVDGNRDKILNCTIVTEFDNRIFLSGNPDYPQAIFWCSEQNPEYFASDDYLEVGLDLSAVKTLIPGNNVLWVMKELSQNSASVYYLTPTIDSTYGKYYVPVGGNVSVACVSTGINFNDDIVYFSRKGLEGINSSSMYSEQLLAHRSTYIDAKLLQESGYESLKVCEYLGYLMVLVNSHVYLADQRKKISTGSGDTEYEWFYWELPNAIKYITEYQGTLYLGNANGQIFKLSGTNDNGEDISSYWTTRSDDFGYPSYTKTTNKKGANVTLKKMNNDAIIVTTIPDGTDKNTQTLSDSKGYAVFKIKNKKFNRIQYKFSSNKPFGIYSAIVQGFLAGYLKR